MYKAIVIGTSFGGIEALKATLPLFKKDFPLAILVVIHMGKMNNDLFIRNMNDICQMYVKEAEDKENIEIGTIYFAPPNYHLQVENDYTISLSSEEKVNYSRPSIDILFETAAWCYKQELIGVLLTGLNNDGAMGLLAIKTNGGICLCENPNTAVASIMPQAGINATKPELILELHQIAEKLNELVIFNYEI